MLQTTLDGTGKRKKREAKIEDVLPDIDPEQEPNIELGQKRTPKFFKALENFFIDLPYSLGLRENVCMFTV